MTMLPVVDGVVYVLGTMLAVWVGPNEPQMLTGVQLQVTPPFAESPATEATTAVDALGGSDRGCGLNVTVIPEAAIVIPGVLALFVVSLTEVAVMITGEEGAVAGAV